MSERGTIGVLAGGAVVVGTVRRAGAFTSEHQPPRRGVPPRADHPVCPCVRVHRPEPSYLQVHHVVPLSWGGADEAANKIAICGTAHDSVHDLLNRLVRAGPEGRLDLRAENGLVRRLAVQALDAYRRDHGHWPTVLTASRPS